MTRLKKAKDAQWCFDVGELYRIVGAWHIWDGRQWAGAGGIVAGKYCGQMPGNVHRHIFEDCDGDRYLASSPMHTHCLETSRVYKISSTKRVRRAA